MKKILALGASGNVAGPITALVKAVNLPHPETPDKQRVTFTDGENDMDCNIYGKHLHMGHEKVGDVVKIEFKDSKAAYLTVFPEGGRCLTLRDGVTYTFRAPKEGTVPTSEDRIVAMARHYALCFQNAHQQLLKVCPGITPDVVQPVATVLFIDTKHTVKVKVGCADDEPLWSGPPKPENPPAPEKAPESPKEEPAPPAGEKEPEAPETKPEPAPEPKERPPAKGKKAEKTKAYPELGEKEHETLLNLEYPKFIEKARGALCYIGEDATKQAWKELFIKVADNYYTAGTKPKVWMDIYDDIWQSSTPKKQDALDDAIAEAVRMKPNATDNSIHRAIAILASGIPNEA